MKLRHQLRRARDRAIGRMDAEHYRRLGMRIGQDVQIGPDCRLDPSTAWMITIGDDVVLAPGVQVLAHDAALRRRIGYTKIAPTTIGSRVFIGANSTILPGLCIGDDVVIGAGSLVSSDIPENTLAYGHPARPVMPLDVYAEQQRRLLETGGAPRYNEGTPGRTLTRPEREAMRSEVPAGKYGWGV